MGHDNETCYIYLLTQDQVRGYDTYNACVVCAKNEDEARLIRPDGKSWGGHNDGWHWIDRSTSWASALSRVRVEKIGTADGNIKPGIIMSSFNAG